MLHNKPGKKLIRLNLPSIVKNMKRNWSYLYTADGESRLMQLVVAISSKVNNTLKYNTATAPVGIYENIYPYKYLYTNTDSIFNNHKLETTELSINKKV